MTEQVKINPDLLIILVGSVINKFMSNYQGDYKDCRAIFPVYEFINDLNKITHEYTSRFPNVDIHFPQIDLKLLSFIITRTLYHKFVTVTQDRVIIDVLPHVYENFLKNIVATSTLRYAKYLLKSAKDLHEAEKKNNHDLTNQPVSKLPQSGMLEKGVVEDGDQANQNKALPKKDTNKNLKDDSQEESNDKKIIENNVQGEPDSSKNESTEKKLVNKDHEMTGNTSKQEGNVDSNKPIETNEQHSEEQEITSQLNEEKTDVQSEAKKDTEVSNEEKEVSEEDKSTVEVGTEAEETKAEDIEMKDIDMKDIEMKDIEMKDVEDEITSNDKDNEDMEIDKPEEKDTDQIEVDSTELDTSSKNAGPQIGLNKESTDKEDENMVDNKENEKETTDAESKLENAALEPTDFDVKEEKDVTRKESEAIQDDEKNLESETEKITGEPDQAEAEKAEEVSEKVQESSVLEKESSESEEKSPEIEEKSPVPKKKAHAPKKESQLLEKEPAGAKVEPVQEAIQSRKRSRSPVPGQQYKRFQNIAVNLLNSIHEHRFSSPFLQPVNAKDAPDYHNIIFEPRDLKNILKAVKSKRDSPTYQSVKELERDIMLMFANCIMYNRTGDDLIELTRIMKKEVSEIFKMFEEAEEEIK